MVDETTESDATTDPAGLNERLVMLERQIENMSALNHAFFVDHALIIYTVLSRATTEHLRSVKENHPKLFNYIAEQMIRVKEEA